MLSLQLQKHIFQRSVSLDLFHCPGPDQFSGFDDGDFVAELFQACRDEGIQTCCESTFHADWKEIEKILPVTDIMISDIKHMDPEIHKEYTGVTNDRILANLKRNGS